MDTMKTPNGTVLPLLVLNGKKYLQVAHRLVWFREDHPLWGISTEVHYHEGFALSAATIRDETGRVLAMGHKREDQSHFPDYGEKSETGAVGRALALLGYGTQFAPDLDEGERIVDAPITHKEELPDFPSTAPAAQHQFLATNQTPHALGKCCDKCGGKLTKGKDGKKDYCYSCWKKWKDSQ